MPRLSFGKKDWYWMCVLTTLYAIVSFTQLGALTFPTTTWQPTVEEQSFIIELEGNRHATAIYTIYGEGNNNLYESGYVVGYHNLKIEGSNNLTNWDLVTVLENGSIYHFNVYEADLHYHYYRINAPSLMTSLTEIAFRNETEDGFIKAHIYQDDYQGSAYPASLVLDEQAFMVLKPTYMDEAYFDEVYHPRNAWEIKTGTRMYAHVHPLLGTLMISWGIRLFGMNPFGWRFAGAFVGVLLVPIFYALAYLLLRSTKWSTLATLLFVTDFMHITTSRIGTLEPFSILWIILMFYEMIRFYQLSFYNTDIKKLFCILLIDGIFMGLGIATKWTACYSAVGLAVILFANLFHRYCEYRHAKKYLAEHPDESHPALKNITSVFVKKFWAIIGWCFVCYIFIPIILYFGTYLFTPVWADGWSVQHVIDQILYMYHYHADLTATHPYQSTWYMWILDIRPIWYYSGTFFETVQHTIACFSHPVSCITGFAAVPYMLYRFVKTRDHDAFVILIGYLSALIPWILVTRCVFAYHFYPTSIFMLLGVAWAMKDLKVSNRVLLIYSIVVIMIFILFLPVITGFGTSLSYIHFLEWLPSWYFG